MADEKIVTNIVANADFSGLIADVNKVAASLSKLQAQIIQSDARLASQVATMNRSFGENLRRTGQFATHFVTLTSDVEKFGTNLDRGQMKLKQYFQTFNQHTKTQGGLIRDLAKQQVALQNAIIQPMGKNAQGLMQYSVHIPQGLDAIKNKTALAKQELQIMNKVIQDGGVQLINWGKNTQWAGRQLTVGLTVPLAAFGKAAADAFRAADAELVRLTKVYGGVAATSAAELGKVRREVTETAKEISKAYGVSFKDTITLAADIAATGKQGNDLLQSVKETSRLAVLGEVDRQEAMKATLAIQTTFKQNTDQLSESINFLNSVENQTSTSLADLIEAIPKAGPVIQGMGGSVKDLALYMTAMKEGGINAAEGANALKSALASLINPTKVAQEKFSEMGIDLGGIVKNNAGNLTATIFALQEALDNLDPLQKQQAIEQLFGKFQFARLNALFSNLGKQGSQTLQVMDLMKASSQELATVAGRELSMVTESASGKYKRAVEGLKADLAGIGDEFLKIQTFFINVVDGIIKFINKLPDPIKSLLTFVTGFTAIIGPVIMLTGVLANFFGYIIKGASHFRALFKGGEGWKMLTPEILAAQKAGSLVEQTFYSDAKAATVLKTAIAGLVTEFELLQSKAMTGAVSVAPALSTMAGNVVTQSGARVVNPNHPLISPEDTRSMSHLNPVAGMTLDQKSQQTIFGVVPGAPKVNQKIGNNPQMYMEGDLPKIPGLTSIGGASTGIVASEAAKWHAMTGALAMQSQEEIALLKKEVAATGLITNSLSDSYQALLPTMTKLTANAATESAAIVAQLQAGKLTVDQARAKIIALNAQVEAMITQASIDIAGQQGRTIGLTTVPLLNQPVVNAAGKSNMKELLRPGRTRSLLNKIAQGLGVKTFGAGYSTETTMPKRMSNGGPVYLADGDRVPGSPQGTDTVPAWLTPGEFVVNAEATKENLPLLQAINGKGSDGPYQNLGSNGPVEGGYEVRTSGLSGEEVGKVIPGFSGDPNRVYTLKGTSGLYIGDVTDPEIVNAYGTDAQKKAGKITRQSINLKMKNGRIPGKVLVAAIKASGSANRGSTEQFLMSLAKNGIITPEQAKQTSNSIYDRYMQKLSSQGIMVGDDNNNYHTLASKTIQQSLSSNPEVKHLWDQFSQNVGAHTGDTTSKSGRSGASTSALAQTLTTTDGKKIKVGTLEGSKGVTFAHAKSPEPFLARLGKAGLGAFKLGSRLPRGRYTPGAYRGFNPIRRSMGGPVYMSGGGMIPQYLAKGSGGPVGRYGSMLSTIRGNQTLRAPKLDADGNPMAPDPNSGMASSMAGMGLMMGGTAVPGAVGQGMQFAGMAMQMAPLLKMLGPMAKGMSSLAGVITKLRTVAMAAFTAMRIGLAALLGPVGLISAGIAALVVGFLKVRKEMDENKKEQTMLNGITEAGAKQAGIKYNNLSDSIKGVRDQMELFRTSQLNTFNSQNSSGIAGLTLTIKELQDKIKAAKTDMPEFVSSLNSLSKSAQDNKTATIDMATNWKAQFVAGGMSVSEATNEIYAIIKASDMANHAFAAITDTGFSKIVDKGTAVNAMFKNLTKNMSNLSGSDLGNALSNVVIGIDSARQSLVGTKDANGEIITQQKALEITMKQLATSASANKTLTEEQIVSLKATHPELSKILNSTDNVRSTYAKWRIMLSGVKVDLKEISAEQAESLSRFIDLQNAAIEAAKTAKAGQDGYVGSISQSAKLVEKLNKRILAGGTTAEKNAQRTKDQINEEIKAIDKRIKKIQEEADARIKAIQKTQSAESYAVQLKQAQLDLQAAIASGDKEAQVRAQLALSALQKERESEMAIAAIQDDSAAKVKAEEARKAKLQEELDALSKRVAVAQAKAADITAVRDKVLGYQSQRDALLSRQGLNAEKLKAAPTDKAALQEQEDIRIAFSNLANAASKDAKGKDKALADAIKEAFVGVLVNAQGESIGGKLMPATHPKGSATWKGGSGLDLLKSDASSITSKIEESNVILKDIRKALGGSDGSGTFSDPKKITSVPVYDTISMKSVDAKGELSDQAREDLVRKNKYKAGTFFEYGGVKYKVNTGYDAKFRTPGAVVVKKSLGGPFAAGQLIEINDRINPLGAQPEGIMIKPDFSGKIYPNAATMPTYDIPSGGYSGYTNQSSGGSSGSAPVINNYITATPNMDIKQLAREVGMVTAKAVSRGGNNRGYSNGTPQVVNI
jgi:TP901 family phage tail tape measure protein